MKYLFQIMALLTLLLLPSLAGAQVNTERYRLDPGQDGLSGSTTFSLAWRTGNVGLLESGVSAHGAARKGDDLLLLMISGKYAARRTTDDRVANPDGTLFDEEARHANQLLGAVRYNRDLTEVITAEAFSQVEFNEFLRLDLRTLGGAGVRILLAGGDNVKAWLGTGYMLEYESTDPEEVREDPETLAHRSTSYVSFSWNPSDRVMLSSTSYLQPRLTDFEDFRILGEAELAVGISERLSLALAFTLRHDSQPPLLREDLPPLASTDTELLNRFTVAF